MLTKLPGNKARCNSPGAFIAILRKEIAVFLVWYVGKRTHMLDKINEKKFDGTEVD